MERFSAARNHCCHGYCAVAPGPTREVRRTGSPASSVGRAGRTERPSRSEKEAFAAARREAPAAALAGRPRPQGGATRATGPAGRAPRQMLLGASAARVGMLSNRLADWRSLDPAQGGGPGSLAAAGSRGETESMSRPEPPVRHEERKRTYAARLFGASRTRGTTGGEQPTSLVAREPSRLLPRSMLASRTNLRITILIPSPGIE